MTLRRRCASWSALVLCAFLAPAGLGAQGNGATETDETITLGHRTTLWSEVLDEDRPLLIYTPSDYEQSSERYPVLYLLDGEGHLLHAAGVTQFLSRVRRMPEMIVVGVGNIPGPQGRGHNMTPPVTSADEVPNAGGGSDFLAFLRDELQPWVDSNYRTEPFRVLVGHSLGGLFATQVLIEDPDAFQAYISISPSLWWDDGNYVAGAGAIFEDRDELRSSLYMTMGDEGGAMLAGAWSLASILETDAPDSFRWKWTHMPEEDHGSVPHRSLYDGLEWLFDGWILPDVTTIAVQEEDEGWTEIHAYYAELSDRLGYQVKVLEDVADQAAGALALEGRFDEAIRWYVVNAERYPGSARAFNHLGDVYRATCRWEESKANYTKAYGMASDMSYPNLESYRDELATITAEIDSGEECTVPGEETEIEVSEEILETYVGEYEIGRGASATVTLEDGALYLAPPGQSRIRLFAESETEFAPRIVEARLTFTLDEAGAVTGFVLHQGERELTARKVG